MTRWPGDDARPRRRWRWLLAIGLVVSAFALAAAVYEGARSYRIQPGTPPLFSRHGLPALRAIVLSAPGRLLAPLRPEAIARLHLDIAPRDFERLQAKRSEALERQFLITTRDDFVPARLRHAGRDHAVRVRLKGDLTDHLRGDKWSFRVEVAPGQAVLGMRRFSLQAPYTRAFHAEPLFLDFLRREGVLAPRYEIVDLTVNGRRVGRMALEEHFSTELLERQERRDGVILRFDEQTFYDAELAFGAMVPDYDNWRNTRVDAFRRKRVEASPGLRAQFRLADGLLQGLARGDLSASDAFDVDLWGRFLAACEVWSTPHMTHWNNLRFYMNPLTLRLEPIGFDANGHATPHEGLRCIGGVHAMMDAVMQDAALQDAFLRHLRRIRHEVAGTAFEAWLREREARYLPPLAREYPWLAPFPLRALRERAIALQSVNEETLRSHIPLAPERSMPHASDADYPTLVHASLVATDAETPVLELANAISLPVTVTELWWEPATSGDAPTPVGSGPHPTQADDSAEKVDRPDVRLDRRKVYHRLSPTPWPTAPELVVVPLPGPVPADAAYTVGGLALAEGRSLRFRARRATPAATAAALPDVSLPEVLARHPFLRRADADDWLEAGPGHFEVDGSLVLPDGVGLRLAPGTTLSFAPDAMLLARGPLAFEGSAAAPIRLAPRQSVWQGIVDLASGAEVSFANVVITDTTEPTNPAWGLTGGVTLHRANVSLRDTRFEGSRAEDALNTVRSELSFERVSILDTRSDGLDADFCRGRIEGGRLERIGGDGIDVSGAKMELGGIVLRDVGDKAVSAGEASALVIREIDVSGAGVGVASKDQSSVEVARGRFGDIVLAAFMAYVKKPQYGPARLEVDGAVVGPGTLAGIAQHGSRLRIDDVTVETEEVDVDGLYEFGAMRK